MWPNPQETADLITFPKKSLIENFIFCAVVENGTLGNYELIVSSFLYDR